MFSTLCFIAARLGLKVEDIQHQERAEKMISWMCGVTLHDRKTSKKLRQRLGIVSVCDRVRQGRQRWFGHVEWKDEGDWVSACIDMSVVEE